MSSFNSNETGLHETTQSDLNGLFSKLMDKIEQPIWRAIYIYYKFSKAKMKINNNKSDKFLIKEDVKQGGILSPYLFNFFMNDLLYIYFCFNILQMT